MSEETPEAAGASDTAPTAEVTPPESGQAATPAEPAATGGIQVPKWAALVVAGLVLLGAGFAIGWVAAPGGGHDGERSIGRGFVPGNGNGPFGRRGIPGNGNGNGTGNGSGVLLGVSTTQTTSGNPSGAQIATVVTGSPADQAGLKAGDVITAVNGNAVSNAPDLIQQIRSHNPGDQVTITYSRNGASTQTQARLGTRAAPTTPS